MIKFSASLFAVLCVRPQAVVSFLFDRLDSPMVEFRSILELIYLEPLYQKRHKLCSRPLMTPFSKRQFSIANEALTFPPRT